MAFSLGRKAPRISVVAELVEQLVPDPGAVALVKDGVARNRSATYALCA
jgi:hypothetical protein